MTPPTADQNALPIVLVPGHWLGGWAWADVAKALEQHGFAVKAVTLPGTSSDDPPGTTLSDQIDALTAVVERQPTPPVMVAHSGAGRVASGVLDRNAAAVSRVVYVDSGPAGDGTAFDPEAGSPERGDAPVGALPGWTDLEAGGASLDGLDDARLEAFRAGAVPVPEGVLTEALQLTNDARLDVPATIIACSMPAATMLELARSGHPVFAEVARLRDLEVVELPTGHWPMWSRPDDLAATIATIASASASAPGAAAPPPTAKPTRT